MLIPHEFEENGHLYKVKGQFVLSTSAVIALNGLSEFGAVPKATLAEASERGKEFHELVRAYEQGEEFDVPEHLDCHMKGYLRFKEEYGFKLFGAMERSCVYQHEGTEYLIGGTPDITGFIEKQLYVIDLKTTYPCYGAALQQKCLAWRLQTQSYAEIFEADDVPNIKRAVVHCHPETGKVRGQEPKYFKFYPFDEDDSHNWDSAIRMAMLKLKSGYKLEER